MIKKPWLLIKKLIHISRLNGNSICSIIINDIEYINGLFIAEQLSNHSRTVATNVDESLPQSGSNPSSYIHNYVPSNCILNLVTVEKCSVLIHKMKVTKQSINQIPIRVFIDFRNHYISVLYEICEKTHYSMFLFSVTTIIILLLVLPFYLPIIV